MDRERRANFEYLSATCRLPDNLSTSGQPLQCQVITDVSTGSYRLPYDVEFLPPSQSDTKLFLL